MKRILTFAVALALILSASARPPWARLRMQPATAARTGLYLPATSQATIVYAYCAEPGGANGIGGPVGSAPVTAWLDSSGATLDTAWYSPSAPDWRPWTTNVLNGRWAVHFPSTSVGPTTTTGQFTNVFTNSLTTSVAQPFTLFAVLGITQTTAAKYYFSSPAATAVLGGLDSSRRWIASGTATLTDAASLSNKIYLIELYCNGASSYIRTNDVQAAAGDIGGRTATKGAMIGCAATTGTFPFAGDVCFLALYSGTLSSDEHTGVVNAITNFYVISPGL